MMTIGIGATSRATASDIAAAIVRAELLVAARADAIASIDGSRFLEPLSSAARTVGKTLNLLELDAVRQRSAECQTVSSRSLEVFGIASIAEAAALAAAGPDSRLILPRFTLGSVTAAAAISSDHVKGAP